MESTDLMANRQSLFAVTMSTRCLRTKTAWPLRRGGRRQSGQPSDEILGGKAATMGFRGDLLDGLMRAFFFLKLLPFPGQRHSLADVGTGRQRFIEGIRRARL